MPTVSAWNVEARSAKLERAIRLLALHDPPRKAKRRLRVVDDPPPESEHWRPRTRADCATFERPCPYIGCKYHNVHTMGWIPHNDDAVLLRIEQLGEDSCALDVADRLPEHTDDDQVVLGTRQVAKILNVTRQRIDQIMQSAYPKLGREQDLRDLHEQIGAPNECTHGYYGQPTPAKRY